MRAALESGARATPGQAPPSLIECAERWLEAKCARLRISTATHHAEVLARHVLPFLGGVRIDRLTRGDIDAWLAWAESATMEDGRPYAHDTIAGWWRLLKQLVRDLCADYRLVDPTLRVRAPEGQIRGRRESGTLSVAELGELVEAVRLHKPTWYAEVYTLVFSGMRGGELYALTWEDIDERAGVIHVQRSHWNGVVNSTKTRAPREVALTPAMLEVLRTHRRSQPLAEPDGLQRGLVFPSARGKHRRPAVLARPMLDAARHAGIEQRLGAQVLRRTLNTLLALDGVDRLVLRSQMGHCSEQMTERYAGIRAEAKRDAVSRLESKTVLAPTLTAAPADSDQQLPVVWGAPLQTPSPSTRWTSPGASG